MTWNYRVMKYTDGTAGIHEVYYDDGGNAESWTKYAVGIVADAPEEISGVLEMIRVDIEHGLTVLEHGGHGERSESVFDIGSIINCAIEDLCGRPCRREEFQLLLGTAAVESDFIYRRQLNDGPARGLWQMEPTTGLDIFYNHLAYRHELRRTLCRLWLHVADVSVGGVTEVGWHLERNDRYACMMARIHYMRDPNPIPKDLDGIARYWKSVYNTHEGAGTVEEFQEKWVAHDCDSIVATYFGNL